MNKDEMKDIIRIASECWPHSTFTPSLIQAWCNRLGGFNREIVEQAVRKLATTCEFLPTAQKVVDISRSRGEFALEKQEQAFNQLEGHAEKVKSERTLVDDQVMCLPIAEQKQHLESHFLSNPCNWANRIQIGGQFANSIIYARIKAGVKPEERAAWTKDGGMVKC